MHKRGAADSQTHLHSPLSISNPNHYTISLEVFSSLHESYEAKKKRVSLTRTLRLLITLGYRHYIPATSKVLSIIDKGVRDRVTKNGETLRRHAESAQRWKNLRDRISRTDADMQVVRKRLTEATPSPSEAGSSTVSLNRSSLGTPESETRSNRSSKALSRSISPFRKFARKIAASARQSPRASPPQLPPVTPLTITKNGLRSPVSEPPRVLRRQRSSIMVGQADASQTPERLGHKHSHSLTLDPETPSDSKIGRAHV